MGQALTIETFNTIKQRHGELWKKEPIIQSYMCTANIKRYTERKDWEFEVFMGEYAHKALGFKTPGDLKTELLKNLNFNINNKEFSAEYADYIHRMLSDYYYCKISPKVHHASQERLAKERIGKLQVYIDVCTYVMFFIMTNCQEGKEINPEIFNNRNADIADPTMYNYLLEILDPANKYYNENSKLIAENENGVLYFEDTVKKESADINRANLITAYTRYVKAKKAEDDYNTTKKIKITEVQLENNHNMRIEKLKHFFVKDAPVEHKGGADNKYLDILITAIIVVLVVMMICILVHVVYRWVRFNVRSLHSGNHHRIK